MDQNAYSEIGNILRTAREDNHWELNDVARLLHIRARYIDALEKGNLSVMPGLPYVKGYLQAYAAFLGLDKDEIMRRFERVDGQVHKRGFYLPKAFHSDKKPPQAAIWGSLAAVLLLYSLWHMSAREYEVPVSLVEEFDYRHSPEVKKYAAMARNPACFRSEDGLYPPCYLVTQKEPEFRLVPLQGRPRTVLELWDRQMAQADQNPEIKIKRSHEYDIIIKTSDLPPG